LKRAKPLVHFDNDPLSVNQKMPLGKNRFTTVEYRPASNQGQETVMPELSGHNFIAGGRSAAGSVMLHSVDATTGQALPTAFIQATAEEVDAAAQAAHQAYPIYRHLPAERRAQFLEAIAAELDALGEDFISLVCQETALPAARIQGERARTSGQMRLFAQTLRRGDFYGARIDLPMPERKPLPRGDLRQCQLGVGPVAVFGASNFPLAFSTAGGDTAAALAAGCPVVFKAHSGHMATAERVAEAIIRAAEKTAMPAGVFNMIFGAGVGEALVKHPLIQAVGFTGSLKGGRALCDMAAARPQPIPVFAEMSSINPVLVLPQALQVRGERIAAELAASVVMGAGQFCTNPGLVIGIRSPAFTAFVQTLSALMADQPAQTMLNAGGLRSYEQGCDSLLAHPQITHLAGQAQQGHQAQAQLFKADVSLLLTGNELLQEEIFGPATVVVEVADRAELLAALQGLRGQLTATLLGEAAELEQAADLVAVLEQKVGRVLINGYPTGVEVCDAMVHGGPWPATSDARGTSVGTLAIERFLRPVCYQNFPDALLPEALKNSNPLGLTRLVNGEKTAQAL
jgi:NADP-dependent aldehyde dehydrogenase